MKKVLLSMMFLTTICGFSQENDFQSPVKKGTISLSGTIAGAYEHRDNDLNESTSNYQSISFHPSLGFLVQDNLELGVRLGFRFNESETAYSGYDSKRSQRFFSGGLYAKQYVVLHTKFLFNVDGGLNLAIQDTENSKVSVVSANFYPGFTYLFTQKLALQFNLGELKYATTRFKNKESNSVESSSNGLNLSLNNISLGFQLFF